MSTWKVIAQAERIEVGTQLDFTWRAGDADTLLVGDTLSIELATNDRATGKVVHRDGAEAKIEVLDGRWTITRISSNPEQWRVTADDTAEQR
jgi:predicted lipid-binding transport protein (Tim44 family)